MSDPLDLEQHLRAFGLTLERATGESITPAHASDDPLVSGDPVVEAAAGEGRAWRRRRVGLVAAAVIVVVGGGAAIWAARDTAPNEPLTTLPAPATSDPGTTTSTSVEPTVGDEALSDLVVDLTSNSFGGVSLGVGQGAEDVLIALEPVLGSPDFDSGWVEPVTITIEDPSSAPTPLPATPCQELTEYREFWWDDLTIGTWQAGSREYFQFWHVGDRQLVPQLIPSVDGPTSRSDSGLQTADGIAIGDSIDTVEALPGATRVDTVIGGGVTGRPEIDVALLAVVDPDLAERAPVAGLRGYYGVDGSIVAFGVTTVEC